MQRSAISDKGNAAGTSSHKAYGIGPDKIDRVIGTAARLFAAKGFDRVGIRDIALESDVKTPSIYYHFASKEALYDEVSEWLYELAMERVANSINANKRPGEQIAGFVSDAFDLFLADRTFFLQMQRDVIDASARQTPNRFNAIHHYAMAASRKMLSNAAGREVSNRDTFAVLAMILGFCELTSVASPPDSTDAAWQRSQKQHLTEIVGRILDIELASRGPG